MSETNEEKNKRWFYYGYNRDETIDYLMEKLNDRDAEIAGLKKRIAEMESKNKQIPFFLSTSSFMGGGVDK